MYHWPDSKWCAATATAAAAVQKRGVAASFGELAHGERPVLISHKEHGPISLETRQLREHGREGRAHQHVPETNDERSEDDGGYRQRGRPEPKHHELRRPREYERAHQ